MTIIDAHNHLACHHNNLPRFLGDENSSGTTKHLLPFLP